MQFPSGWPPPVTAVENPAEVRQVGPVYPAKPVASGATFSAGTTRYRPAPEAPPGPVVFERRQQMRRREEERRKRQVAVLLDTRSGSERRAQGRRQEDDGAAARGINIKA